MTSLAEPANIEIQDWGLIEYQEALLKQERLAEDVASSQSRGVLVFCSHPPVVTRGRATKPDDISTWSGPQIEISRGGRATYHGPSQLVIYPIWNLAIATPTRPAKDIGIFLRNFENAIVHTLVEFGISATGKTYRPERALMNRPERALTNRPERALTNRPERALTNPPAGKSAAALEDTGVWVGERKIASLGIAIRKWVSFHGAALNVEYDPEAFKGLLPCGYLPNVMVSMQEVSGNAPDRKKLKELLAQKLNEKI